MAEQRDGAVEHEMTTYQRGVVDTCLEEGQFESAIALMEQLRSASYKPPLPHVRQLIYISLLPEKSSGTDEPTTTDIPSSPSRAMTRKRVPSGRAVLAARHLLNSYVLTNTPGAIARALPRCDDPRRDQPLSSDDCSSESVIGAESMCILRAKDCWSILAEGFLQRWKRVPVPSIKGKKRAHDVEQEDDSMGDLQNVVGPDAWPLLNWLINLFEQDEMLQNACDSGGFSNLLLQQIPFPRSGTGPRWDAGFPLRIVFFCLEQVDIRHQMLGSRLFSLLINLVSTPHLDFPMFVASVYSRLTALGLDKLPALFDALNPSLASHKFKVALCQKLLTDPSHGGHSKPQPRAQPRAIRQNRPDVLVIEDTNSSTLHNGTSTRTTNSLLPAYTEIKKCLEVNVSPSTAITAPFMLRIKFELVISYGTMQSELPLERKDAEWLVSLHTGRGYTVDLVCGPDDKKYDQPLRMALRDILQAWYLSSSSEST